MLIILSDLWLKEKVNLRRNVMNPWIALVVFFIVSVVIELISDHFTGYQKAYRATHSIPYKMTHELTYKVEGFVLAYLLLSALTF